MNDPMLIVSNLPSRANDGTCSLTRPDEKIGDFKTSFRMSVPRSDRVCGRESLMLPFLPVSDRRDMMTFDDKVLMIAG